MMNFERGVKENASCITSDARVPARALDAAVHPGSRPLLIHIQATSPCQIPRVGHLVHGTAHHAGCEPVPVKIVRDGSRGAAVAPHVLDVDELLYLPDVHTAPTADHAPYHVLYTFSVHPRSHGYVLFIPCRGRERGSRHGAGGRRPAAGRDHGRGGSTRAPARPT